MCDAIVHGYERPKCGFILFVSKTYVLGGTGQAFGEQVDELRYGIM